jgi:intein/homing endonuclease
LVRRVSQDLSVAGKQAGIHEGARSSLFFEAIRIIKEMRDATNEVYPRFAVWENVCFAGDTLVACEDGYKLIKDIAVGDKVKTLDGKYYPVKRVYKTKWQKVMRLKVSGGEDLIVTPNHPFWAREKLHDSGMIRSFTEPHWCEAGNLTNESMIAYKIDEPTLPDDFISEDEAWAIGRWIADGSVDLKKSNPRIFISTGYKKADNLREQLLKLPYAIHENHPHRTAINFSFTSRDFYSLVKEAGIGAGEKKIPPYVFNLPINLQKCVLEGYASGDGYVRRRGNGVEFSASTASRELAYGIARLIRNVHHVAADISSKKLRNTRIGQRDLKANYPSYNVTASLTNKCTRALYENGFVWQPVKAIVPLDEKIDVYNLSVWENNTYGANDVMVHNCGAFSSNKGQDFQAVLQEFCNIRGGQAHIVPLPPKGKWLLAGSIVGNGFSLAWRVLDAAGWGVPQRRKRIFLVADFAGERAAEILFDENRLHGHPAPGGEAGQGTAADAQGSVGRSSGGGGGSMPESVGL